jgi:hypothetical protein
MMRNDEAKWQRLELQCALMSISLSAEPHETSPRSVAGDDLPSAGCSTPTFGGTVTAPANAIAVDAIGNAFAKGATPDGLPTSAEVTPVYSSADHL